MTSVVPRLLVRSLYRQFLHVGKEYPEDFHVLRQRVKDAFRKNGSLRDAAAVEQAVARGQYVLKEMEALIFLKKYRALKRMYYKDGSS